MEKAKHPTSTYKVFCDTYDTECTAEIHQVEDEIEVENDFGNKENKLVIKNKLQFTIETFESSLSLSLYLEDVQFLAKYLEVVMNNIERRN